MRTVLSRVIRNHHGLKNSHPPRDCREAVSGETLAGSPGRPTEEIAERFDKARIRRIVRE